MYHPKRSLNENLSPPCKRESSRTEDDDDDGVIIWSLGKIDEANVEDAIAPPNFNRGSRETTTAYENNESAPGDGDGTSESQTQPRDNITDEATLIPQLCDASPITTEISNIMIESESIDGEVTAQIVLKGTDSEEEKLILSRIRSIDRADFSHTDSAVDSFKAYNQNWKLILYGCVLLSLLLVIVAMAISLKSEDQIQPENYLIQTSQSISISPTPSVEASLRPSSNLFSEPSAEETFYKPSTYPSGEPSSRVSSKPSTNLSNKLDTGKPSTNSFLHPNLISSTKYSYQPSLELSTYPSNEPSTYFTNKPHAGKPSTNSFVHPDPSGEPSTRVSSKPSAYITNKPEAERPSNPPSLHPNLVSSISHQPSSVANTVSISFINKYEVKTFVASDGKFVDKFGKSCSMSEELVVIGANRADNEEGAVYLFDLNGNEIKKLTPGNDGKIDDNYGNSVSLDKKIVVGTCLGNYFQVFSLNGEHEITIRCEDCSKFADNVATYEDIIVVYGNQNSTEKLFMYSTEGEMMKEIEQEGEIDDIAISDQLIVSTAAYDSKTIVYSNSYSDGFPKITEIEQGGYKIAVAGDRLVIGDYTTNTHDGAAWLYKTDGTFIKNLDSLGTSRFGWSLAITDNKILVGTDGYTGSVFIYSAITGEIQGKILAPQGPVLKNYLQKFGRSVCATDSYFTIGADIAHTSKGFFTGAAYLYQPPGL